jgi:hypothetical protein
MYQTLNNACIISQGCVWIGLSIKPNQPKKKSTIINGFKIKLKQFDLVYDYQFGSVQLSLIVRLSLVKNWLWFGLEP